VISVELLKKGVELWRWAGELLISRSTQCQS